MLWKLMMLIGIMGGGRECELKREQDIVNSGGGDDFYVTECTDEGAYAHKQCHVDLCWCVDSDGTQTFVSQSFRVSSQISFPKSHFFL